MPENMSDRAILAHEPKRDHTKLRDRLKSLTPIQEPNNRSAAYAIPLDGSINYATLEITSFRPSPHSRTTYIVVFNPKEQSSSAVNMPVPDAKALIIRPELHGHEHDHIIRVPMPKVEEMLAEFATDPNSAKFRPQKLRSDKPEDIRRYKELKTAEHGQIVALLRLLQSATRQPTQETGEPR